MPAVPDLGRAIGEAFVRFFGGGWPQPIEDDAVVRGSGDRALVIAARRDEYALGGADILHLGGEGLELLDRDETVRYCLNSQATVPRCVANRRSTWRGWPVIFPVTTASNV